MGSFFFTIFSLFFLFSLWIHVSSAGDTISADEISGDQTIISSNGTFEMGFFQPGTSSKFYIGTWYKQLREQPIVWVANREKPVTDKQSSVLKISNGNLILTDDQNQTPVWSTGLKPTSSSPLEAVLQDDGNLVLRDESDSVLWQSFDHPANTWLPGAKLRFDKRTNKSQKFISWKNEEDPSPGLFSLELDDSTAYKILWNGSNEYWSSGPWNQRSKIFELVPEMRLNYIYNYSFVSNATESYFIYTVYNPTNLSRLVMDISGQIKQYTSLKNWNQFWAQPRQQCEVYAYCGSFGVCNEKSQPFCQCPQGFRPTSQKDWDLKDYSAGCVTKTELQCREGEASEGNINKFLPLPNMKLPEKPDVLLGNTSLSGCGSACLRNCSCNAYAHNESSNRCSMWSKHVLKLEQLEEDNSEGKTFYLRHVASDIPNGSSRNDVGLSAGAKAGIASASGFVVVLILIAGSLICAIRFPRKTSDNLRQHNIKALIPLKHYSYAQVKRITKSFVEVVGKGGFGTVYRGNLFDGRSVAVKILKDSMGNGEDFINEVASMSKTSHVNIVSLLGFCSEGSKRAIIYEYLENGSLDQFISSKTSTNMDWKALYGIALGVARGLEYLHHGCKTRIVHFDIKPQNVLLDENLCPKVSDFGLAKLCEKKESILSLLDMRGTIGYIAPEVFSRMYGRVSHKSDVYSYGMLVLEMIGARNKERADENYASNTSSMYFPEWIYKDLEKVDSERLIENGINSEEEEIAKKMTIVGLWCIQPSPTDRPPMNRVVEMMEGNLNALEVPPRPVLQQISLSLLQESSTLSEDSRFTEKNVSLNVI